MSDLGIREKGNVVVVSFPDIRLVDETRIADIGAQFNDFASEFPKKHILLNFDNVKFMSSSMIGKIVKLSKDCKQRGRELRICELSPEIDELFRMMNLDQHIGLHKREASGIEILQRKQKWFLGRKTK